MSNIHKQHREMVANLAKPGQEILQTMTPRHAHMLHMAIGISGEVGEIVEWLLSGRSADRAALVEECGDLEFYFVGLCDIVGYNTTPLPKKEVDSIAPWQLITAAAHVIDVVKKIVIYSQEAKEEALPDTLALFHEALSDSYSWFGLSAEEAKKANLAKLLTGPNARYAAGTYSDEAAHARADKAAEDPPVD